MKETLRIRNAVREKRCISFPVRFLLENLQIFCLPPCSHVKLMQFLLLRRHRVALGIPRKWEELSATPGYLKHQSKQPKHLLLPWLLVVL